MLVEERHYGPEGLRREDLRAMAGAGDDHQGRVDASLLERRVQLPTLADGYGGVPVAVEDQEGRVIPGDVGNGAGAAGRVLALEDRAAEEQGFRRIGSVVPERAVGAGLRRDGEEVRRAKDVADGLDAAADA